MKSSKACSFPLIFFEGGIFFAFPIIPFHDGTPLH